MYQNDEICEVRMRKRNQILRLMAFLLVIFLVGSACRISRRDVEESVPPILEPQTQLTVPTPLPVEEPPLIIVPEYAALEGSLEALYEIASPGVVSLQFSNAQAVDRELVL